MSNTAYDFETLPDRKNTGSMKWERYAAKDLLPFWVADMDFLSAPEIIEALTDRARHGVFGYTVPPASTVEATLEYLRSSHRYNVHADSLIWLPGLVPALNLCCRAFCSEDESVMTCTPVYPPFLSSPTNAGRERIDVSLRHTDQGWDFDWERMEAAVQPNTRVFILCSPHNPVGHVFRKKQLEALEAFCERHDLILISDEIHCDLIFDDSARHILTATLSPSLAQRTVTLMAPSKTYNLPGLACAYAVIENPRLRARFQRTAAGIITEINAFGYTGCEAAYRFGNPWRLELLKVLRSNYQLVRETLRTEMPELVLHPMHGTYLAWIEVSSLGLRKPVSHFEEFGIALSDGTPFGDANYLRLNFGCPRHHLLKGLDCMIEATRAARAIEA